MEHGRALAKVRTSRRRRTRGLGWLAAPSSSRTRGCGPSRSPIASSSSVARGTATLSSPRCPRGAFSPSSARQAAESRPSCERASCRLCTRATWEAARTGRWRTCGPGRARWRTLRPPSTSRSSSRGRSPERTTCGDWTPLRYAGSSPKGRRMTEAACSSWSISSRSLLASNRVTTSRTRRLQRRAFVRALARRQHTKAQVPQRRHHHALGLPGRLRAIPRPPRGDQRRAVSHSPDDARAAAARHRGARARRRGDDRQPPRAADAQRRGRGPGPAADPPACAHAHVGEVAIAATGPADRSRGLPGRVGGTAGDALSMHAEEAYSEACAGPRRTGNRVVRRVFQRLPGDRDELGREDSKAAAAGRTRQSRGCVRGRRDRLPRKILGEPGRAFLGASVGRESSPRATTST